MLDEDQVVVVRVPKALAEAWRADEAASTCRIERAEDGSMVLRTRVGGAERVVAMAPLACGSRFMTPSGDVVCPEVSLVVVGSVAEWFPQRRLKPRTRCTATSRVITHEDLLILEDAEEAEEEADDVDDAEAAATRTRKKRGAAKRRREPAPPDKKHRENLSYPDMALKGIAHFSNGVSLSLDQFKTVSGYTRATSELLLRFMTDDELMLERVVLRHNRVVFRALP